MAVLPTATNVLFLTAHILFFAIRPLRGSHLTILPLGDSITQWMCGQLEFKEHPDHFSMGGYRGPLFNRLSQDAVNQKIAPNVPVGCLYDCGQHMGVSGIQCDELLSSGWVDRSVGEYRPDVVLLQCGTNDMYNEPDLGMDRPSLKLRRDWNITEMVRYVEGNAIDIDHKIRNSSLRGGLAPYQSQSMSNMENRTESQDEPIVGRVVNRMNMLIDRIFSLSPNTTLLLSSITNVNQTRCIHYYWGACPARMQSRIAAFNARVENEVVNYQNTKRGWSLNGSQIQFHDVNKIVNNGKGFVADDYYTYGIHFSLQGFQKLADTWHGEIMKWWGRKQSIEEREFVVNTQQQFTLNSKPAQTQSHIALYT